MVISLAIRIHPNWPIENNNYVMKVNSIKMNKLALFCKWAVVVAVTAAAAADAAPYSHNQSIYLQPDETIKANRARADVCARLCLSVCVCVVCLSIGILVRCLFCLRFRALDKRYLYYYFYSRREISYSILIFGKYCLPVSQLLLLVFFDVLWPL